ncbi:hypothetical protein [Halosimplex sp. TS25]|uniref:hypothetical protein n=1 Tax=Halosimplex rarum TaxID=3396619 RepID=UPI0039EA1D40
MVRTRRAVLAMGAASLSAVAGCLGGGNGDSDGGDGGGDGGGGGGNSGPFPEHTDVTDEFFTKDETIEIPAGKFTGYEIEFENGGALKYNFTVTSGPAIDVLLIRDGEYGYFTDGHEVNYNSAHSVQKSKEASSSADISSGSYHLVFDNSEMAKAQPPTPEPTPTPASDEESTDAMATDSTAADTEADSSTDSSGGSSGSGGTATVELQITAGQ